MPKKKLSGVITSVKMKNTAVVKVERLKRHPKYLRTYKIHKKYKAHIEGAEYAVGEKVIIEECVPVSKDKKWKVIKKVDDKISLVNEK
ncbi:MAG: uS17 family ribosomal protein [Candidatus Nealsonbacteria bacterium]|nr:uS17 family ribosomal protein [Candidatus Nealsonbacteria bacterium]